MARTNTATMEKVASALTNDEIQELVARNVLLKNENGRMLNEEQERNAIHEKIDVDMFNLVNRHAAEMAEVRRNEVIEVPVQHPVREVYRENHSTRNAKSKKKKVMRQLRRESRRIKRSLRAIPAIVLGYILLMGAMVAITIMLVWMKLFALGISVGLAGLGAITLVSLAFLTAVSD